jgi:entericidin B
MSMAAPDCVRLNLLTSGDPMKTILALLTSSVFLVLVGCNTVAGAGKDIERGGEKVQDTAQDVQQKM